MCVQTNINKIHAPRTSGRNEKKKNSLSINKKMNSQVYAKTRTKWRRRRRRRLHLGADYTVSEQADIVTMAILPSPRFRRWVANTVRRPPGIITHTISGPSPETELSRGTYVPHYDVLKFKSLTEPHWLKNGIKSFKMYLYIFFFLFYGPAPLFSPELFAFSL